MRKKLIIVAAALVVALLAVDFAGSSYLLNYAIGAGGDGGNREVALEVEPGADETEARIVENQLQEQQAADAFEQAHPAQQVTVTSDDGLHLAGFLYGNGDSHKWAIVIHGYRNNHQGVVDMARHYYEEGYQVLAPDLRACGQSEGAYLGMGWLDRLDILKWIDFVVQQDPRASIVLHGESMGAATVMMTAGEETPDNVVAFVEDCGYTSVWDIFSSELGLRFGLPEFPLLYTASFLSQVNAGYGFQEASALHQVAACAKPMLFIHGTADDFIPYEMMGQLYSAKPGDNKATITSEGAGHAEAMYELGDAYWDGVFGFLEDL